MPYPAWLAYYPALALYMGFIWLELFGHTTPRTVGLTLVGYTILNFAVAALFGADAWFRHGEFFMVFFRLLGKISPLAYAQSPAPGSKITVRVRRPFIGLIEETADHTSILFFVLFMLSSTAFDGVHETLPWVQVFWRYATPLNLGYRPAIQFLRGDLLRLAVGHALPLALHLLHNLPSCYLDDSWA